MSIARYKVGPRIAAAAKHGDTIYVAGTVADDPKLDAKGQTAQILHKIDEALAHFGSNKSKIVWANVWVSDIRHYDGMNAAWDAVARQGERAGARDRRGAPGDARTTWSRSPSSPAPDLPASARASREAPMGSTTDRVSGRARAVPVSLIRRMSRHDAPRPRGDQPRGGGAGLRDAAPHRRGGLPGAPRRLHQALAEPGLPRPPGGDRREDRAGQRVPGRPGQRGLRDRGRDAGARAHVHGRDRSGRRGARHRSELHELRGDDHAGRRARGLRAHGSRARLPAARRRTSRRRSPRGRARSSSTVPSNPTGAVYPRDLLHAIADDLRCATTSCSISDETYGRLTYGDIRNGEPGVVPRPPRPHGVHLLLLRRNTR